MPSCLMTTCAFLGLLCGDAERPLRFTTFNVWELSRAKLGDVDSAGAGKNRQLQKAAEILQRLRPDVLLINEIDFDDDRRNADLFQRRYLAVSQNGQPPLRYDHLFFEPVNTGVPTGKDLDNDGSPNGPADCFGFGKYPGQYGMALYSRFPIRRDQARTFQKLLWKEMPGNLLPDGSNGKPAFYSPDEVDALRLSSKSHWDVPVQVGRRVIHALCSHPTPPIFDGPEDHNGRRNFDEIRFWADYLTPGKDSYIRDDAGQPGGLPETASFVLMGDLNADPLKGDRAYGATAADLVLRHSRVHDPCPAGAGGGETVGPGAPAHLERKTCNFGRIDYALPSRDLAVQGAGVFWPKWDDPLAELIRNPDRSSDHRAVWVDIEPR